MLKDNFHIGIDLADKDKRDYTSESLIKVDKFMEREKFEYKSVGYSMVEPCPHDREQEIYNETCDKNRKRGSTKITYYMLNQLGSQGWEMCGCMNDGTWNTYYFKRKLTE